MIFLVYATFACLLAVSVGVQLLASRTKIQQSSGNNPHFKAFQKKFFVVYFPALFSDWLQGPYVYKLYSHYGFQESQIAVLYVVGFGASVLFGTATGPLADRFGRKKMCIAFTFMYTFCCLTKVSPNFSVLVLGRIFGGIATSMLFSTFEAWYVYEHVERYDFPQEFISVTFAKTTFWNGVLAIVAGVIANFTAEYLEFGPVSPFLLAIPCLLVSGFLIMFNWEENWGRRDLKFVRSCAEGLRHIVSQPTILLLGLVQALFESVMYIFVFLWTPVLDSAKPPLGMVFSCFMICIMIGSSLYSLLLSQNYSSANVLILASVIQMTCMAVCTLASREMAFFAFLALEVGVGMYFPTAGHLRSLVVPEALRANITNWFRVPMNIMTCGGLLWLHGSGEHAKETLFSICAVMMALATGLAWCFSKRFKGEMKSDTEIEI